MNIKNKFIKIINAVEITLYKDWMKPQIAKLFSMQYGISEKEFSDLIDNFYELPFQKNKCIRIVAKEKDTIIGFQSFFYWPYTYNKTKLNSYQSGNSLVHPDYRGKGVFQQLLNYLDVHRAELKIDFLIGFPIDVSIGSLLRNKWLNVFNLQWFVKMVNPFSIFLQLDTKTLKTHFPNTNLFINTDENQIRILNNQAFADWRSNHYDKEKYYSFNYSENNEQLLLKLKTNIRKKLIKELIIGDIITTTYKPEFLQNALTAFFKEVKKVKAITLVSIAINEESDNNLLKALLIQKFKKINKQIYFCVKPFSNNEIIKSANKWIVYRGDIDTW